MNKILTALLIASATLPIIACTTDTHRQESTQNPLVFKYTPEKFPDYTQSSKSIYTKQDAKGNKTTLMVMPNNDISSILQNSAKYKTIEECEVEFQKVNEGLDKFIISSDEHNVGINGVTTVKYGKDTFTVAKPEKCYASKSNFIYYAAITNPKISPWQKFTTKLSGHWNDVYVSATSPSTWFGK
jgi:hypothetical protein